MRLERGSHKGITLMIGLGLLFALSMGAVIDILLAPDEPANWSGIDGRAAFYAHGQVAAAGGASERLIRRNIVVVDIQSDPKGCDWGYREPITMVATVKTYTLFGIPLRTWQVDCNGVTPL